MADCDDPRQRRLAKALRANLRRRKAAERLEDSPHAPATPRGGPADAGEPDPSRD